MKAKPKKIKWSLLKENKCPKCRRELDWSDPDFFKCECGFGISAKRFKEIVVEMNEHDTEDLEGGFNDWLVDNDKY